MHKAMTFLLMAALVSGVTACGKRGPLSLPQAASAFAAQPMDG